MSVLHPEGGQAMSDCAYCGGIKVMSAVTGGLSRHIPYELPCPECNADVLVDKVAELVREIADLKAEIEVLNGVHLICADLRERLREAYDCILNGPILPDKWFEDARQWLKDNQGEG